MTMKKCDWLSYTAALDKCSEANNGCDKCIKLQRCQQKCEEKHYMPSTYKDGRGKANAKAPDEFNGMMSPYDLPIHDEINYIIYPAIGRFH